MDLEYEEASLIESEKLGTAYDFSEFRKGF